jgi:ribonuclease PH
LQATAEQEDFDDSQLGALVALGRKGVGELIALQRQFVTLP